MKAATSHTWVGFIGLRNMNQARSIAKNMIFKKANFQLFRNLINRTPWETVLRDEGAEQR